MIVLVNTPSQTAANVHESRVKGLSLTEVLSSSVLHSTVPYRSLLVLIRGFGSDCCSNRQAFVDQVGAVSGSRPLSIYIHEAKMEVASLLCTLVSRHPSECVQPAAPYTTNKICIR